MDGGPERGRTRIRINEVQYHCSFILPDPDTPTPEVKDRLARGPPSRTKGSIANRHRTYQRYLKQAVPKLHKEFNRQNQRLKPKTLPQDRPGRMLITRDEVPTNNVKYGPSERPLNKPPPRTLQQTSSFHPPYGPDPLFRRVHSPREASILVCPLRCRPRFKLLQFYVQNVLAQ